MYLRFFLLNYLSFFADKSSLSSLSLILSSNYKLLFHFLIEEFHLYILGFGNIQLGIIASSIITNFPSYTKNLNELTFLHNLIYFFYK